jgi:hypothetical protein
MNTVTYTPKLGDFVTGKLAGEADCRQGWIVQLHPTTVLRGESCTEYNVEGELTLVDKPPSREQRHYRYPQPAQADVALPIESLPANAAVTQVVVNHQRLVQWIPGPGVYHAPSWVWQLVAQAEKGYRDPHTGLNLEEALREREILRSIIRDYLATEGSTEWAKSQRSIVQQRVYERACHVFPYRDIDESEMEPADPAPPGPCHPSELIRNQDPIHYWRGTNPDHYNG